MVMTLSSAVRKPMAPKGRMVVSSLPARTTGCCSSSVGAALSIWRICSSASCSWRPTLAISGAANAGPGTAAPVAERISGAKNVVDLNRITRHINVLSRPIFLLQMNSYTIFTSFSQNVHIFSSTVNIPIPLVMPPPSEAAFFISLFQLILYNHNYQPWRIQNIPNTLHASTIPFIWK